MKLWSYGDSHAAGHELGTDYADDLGARWYQKLGYKDRNHARSIGVFKYNKKVKSKWYKEINDLCTPELSYAGKLASLLSCEFVSRAEPGSSNSLNILKMYQDSKQWHSDDIILFSVVTPLRYIPANNILATNHQVHWLPEDIAKILWKDGPHDVCFRLQTHGYMHMVRNLHKNVCILQTVPDDISVEDITPKFDINFSFTEFISQYYKVSVDTFRYPGGHLHEDCHASFAEYIYNTWKK